MSKLNQDGRYNPSDLEDLRVLKIGTPISLTGTAAGLTSAAPDYSTGVFFTVTAATGVTGTILISNPVNPPTPGKSGILWVEFYNNSGGVVGTISWDTAYKAAAALPTKPADGKKRIGKFVWNGSAWVCVAAPAVDY